MEEKINQHLEEKERALKEARRRIQANQKDLDVWKVSKEAHLAKKEADAAEWADSQTRQRVAHEEHHKKLLDLEQGLHKRTMTRTLDRITRQLKFGDLDDGGRDTPLRELIAGTTVPNIDATRTAAMI